jgi:hypothetical protein
MTFRIEITRTWYYVESDESETWTTDPHRTEHSEIEYDSDAKDLYESPEQWAIETLRGGDFPALEASGCPIPDALPDHWWLSATEADAYTNEESEVTIRLVSPEWTPEMRAEVFRGAKWH